MVDTGVITDYCARAMQARAVLFDEKHEAAFRLLNGFLEGVPGLTVDLYARTLLITDHSADPAGNQSRVAEAQAFYLRQLPWLKAVILKTRAAVHEAARRGRLVVGGPSDRKIRENGVWYAVDLTLNLDASLYLDTRGLRAWAMGHLSGKRVLNTFAYTGSLGVAALAGGASQVIQLDLNRRFLNLAKDSYALNGFPIQRADFRAGDFWTQVNQLKRAGELFDCVFVDPPFFSTTPRGTVNLVAESQRVINKVRPLVAHQGWLAAINNALFLSGAAYEAMLRDLCADGYLSIEALIPVPPDFTGFPETRLGSLPVDPAPFNYSTKIAILRVTRKDQRAARQE
jgi:23S rRNA (cytosine1962-C5)-methyltransferase